MGEQTAISWTDHTFNPWWGCWKIADECKHCYADELANRYAKGSWGRTAPRRFFGDKHWSEPRKWNARAERDGVRRRVFVGSMCDWAEIHPDETTNQQMHESRSRLFRMIDQCRALDWLLLTKRIADVKDHNLLPWLAPHRYGFDDALVDPWPHVWLMMTAGTRDTLSRNYPILRTIPAAVRGISCEPLLEEIPARDWNNALERVDVSGIHWLIVGNESGHKRRPAEMDWVRTARDAAERNGVAFHFKQWVEPSGKKIHLPILDGTRHAAFPEQP
jgi:protein gp37